MSKNDEPKLDLTKPMRLRNGDDDIRILCTDGPGEKPIAGFYKGDFMQWHLDGSCWSSGAPCAMDIVNVPEKRTVWVYDMGEHSSPEVRIERNAILDNDCRSRIRVDVEKGRKDD